MKAYKNKNKHGLVRVRAYFINAKKLVEVELVKHVAKSLSLFYGDSNALTHLLMIGRPGTDVVNGLSLVPADKVKLLVPAVVTLAYDTDLFNDFILNFRHCLFSLKDLK